MTEPRHSITWPAVIQYAGDAELFYIESEQAWSNDPGTRMHRFRNHDRLIDAAGRVFTLPGRHNGLTSPAATSETCELTEIVGMVRAHFAQMGACCVAKFSAGNIREALELIREHD